MAVTVDSVVITYEDNTLVFTLSTGETVTVTMSDNLADTVGENVAQSEVRLNRVYDALRQSMVRVINSLGDIVNLP